MGDSDASGLDDIYQPLEAQTAVRLLELYPGERDTPLIGRLIVTTNPSQYEALSYTWGGSDGHIFTFQNGPVSRSIPITTNLYDGLQQLRDQLKPRWLWVDALCINQANNQEKGHQVMRMGHVFSHASRVLVWLGKGTIWHRSPKTLIDVMKEIIESAKVEAGVHMKDRSGRSRFARACRHSSFQYLLTCPW